MTPLSKVDMFLQRDIWNELLCGIRSFISVIGTNAGVRADVDSFIYATLCPCVVSS